MKRVAAVVIITILASLMVTIPASSATGDNTCWDYSNAELRFKRKANAERADDGLKKLRLDPELSKVARRHTKDMIQANAEDPNTGLFHSTSAQFRKRITNWTIVGENVGVGGDVGSLHEAFMDSVPHAENVLGDDYNNIGVGAKRDDDGRMWVTFIFQGTGNPGTTLKMPACRVGTTGGSEA